MSATNPRCPQCHEGDPVSGPINGVIWHECQHCDYAWSDESTNPPGTSPVYAIARDLTAALNKGRRSYTVADGTLFATLQDGGDYRAVTLYDDAPIQPDTLALWAAAFGVQTAQWAQDWTYTGGKVARLEWPTDGEALPDVQGTLWVGGAR